MVGASEPALVAAMGRAPDTNADGTAGAKLLQWRWHRTYAIPDWMLGYSYAGGAIKPIPHTGEGMVRDGCLAEWTLENGVATRYRWEGNDCSTAMTQQAAR